MNSNPSIPTVIVMLAMLTPSTLSALPQDANEVVISAPAPLSPIDEANLIEASIEQIAAAGGPGGGTSVDRSSARVHIPRGRIERKLVLKSDYSIRALLVVRDLDPGVHVLYWVSQSDDEPGPGSARWATGSVVGSDGIAVFHAEAELEVVGEEPALYVVECGRASDDVEILSRQLLGTDDDCRGDAIAMK